jgi:hypothetical protein
MREALRGALLSVLFFALMIGGAPTMAAADQPMSVASAHMSPGSCGEAGGSWINKSSPGNPNGYCTFDDLTWDEMVGTDPWCRLANAGANIATIDATLIGAVGGFAAGGPVGAFFGGLGGFGLGSLGKLYVGYHCW